MLGRMRHTTRLDVGLSIVFAGISYLVWSLVAGGARELVQTFIYSAQGLQMELHPLTRGVKIFFVDAGFMIDLVGLLWLSASLVLVLLSSRQKIRISWVWVCAICQSFTAALGAILVGSAVYAPHAVTIPSLNGEQDLNLFERVSEISLPALIPVAILIWTTFLVWLLIDRARLNRRGNRHGPTLRDGVRTNVYKT